MRILLAIDGSPPSKAAVDEVCRRPWPPASEVRLITVRCPIELLRLRENLEQPVSGDDIFSQSGWDSLKFLDDAATQLAQCAPELQVTPVILAGQPKEVILDEAENWGAELIIVGSHGHGAVSRFLLGSVSFAIALNASCSVEIVRRPFELLAAEATGPEKIVLPEVQS